MSSIFDLPAGLFLFGTDRVQEFLDKGFTFISLGNDLHHGLTQGCAYLSKVEAVRAHI
jgi:4-hydroxy-2-oxoheptanedioate aldolase